MTTGELIFYWGMSIVGLAGMALCAGAEIGSYSVNRVRLHLAAEGVSPGVRARWLKGEIDRPDRMLLGLLVAVNVFGKIMADGTTALAAAAGYGDWQIVVLNVLLLTPVTLIFAEALPKELFRLEADSLMYRLAGPLRWWRVLLTWTGVLPLLTWFSRWVERLAGLAGKGESLGDARQRIAMLLKEGASHGTLSESQNSLVDRALRLREATVGDEMLLWSQVRTIPADWDRARVMAVADSIPHARVPLVDRRGRVAGVLRLIDLYCRPGEPIERLRLEPARLSEGQSVLAALEAVRASKSGVGIVEKEGRPVGLVTSKDLVEPITGDLPDW